MIHATIQQYILANYEQGTQSPHIGIILMRVHQRSKNGTCFKTGFFLLEFCFFFSNFDFYH